MGKYFILLILFPLITYGQGGFGVDSNKTLDNGKIAMLVTANINNRIQVWSDNHFTTIQPMSDWKINILY